MPNPLEKYSIAHRKVLCEQTAPSASCLGRDPSLGFLASLRMTQEHRGAVLCGGAVLGFAEHVDTPTVVTGLVSSRFIGFFIVVFGRSEPRPYIELGVLPQCLHISSP